MLIDIYNKKQTYNNQNDSFCFQNGIRHILEYYGIKNAGFFINSSLSFIVNVNKMLEYGYSVSYDDNAFSVLPAFKHKAIRNYPSDQNSIDVWKINKEKIDNGIPLIVGVDAYYLDYTPNYKKNHAGHTFIMCGYSEVKKDINFIDWYDPWFYKGIIKFETFMQARSSENLWDGGVYSGHPICNNWAEIDTEGWDESNLALLFQTIFLTIDQYYSEKCGNNTFNGIHGLKVLLSILNDIKLNDIEYRKLFLKDLHTKLYSMVKRKKLFRHYLDIASNDFESNVLKSVIMKLNSIIASWEKFLMLILKAGFYLTDVAYIKIVNHFLLLVQYDEEFFESLYELKSCLEGKEYNLVYERIEQNE